MFAQERQKEIADSIKETGRVQVNDLAEKYHVTKDLIRKDLNVLEQQGLLKKVYGGAVAVRENLHEYSSASRKERNPEGREEIARKAVSLIHNNETIFLDISLTSVKIAELLVKSNLSVHVITNMLEVLNVLAPDKKTDVFFPGGTLNQERDGFWSALTIRNLSVCHIDKAFLGTVGIDLNKNTVSTYHESDGELKRKVMSLSSESYALADSHKFHEDGDYTYASVSDFTALITDSLLDESDKNMLGKEDVSIL